MKKQLKVLAAAVGLSLAATQANANLIQGSDQTQGSALFLAVWNSTTSYVRDLGVTLSTVLNGTTGNINTATAPNPTWVSNAGFTQTFAGDSLFTSTFGSGSLAGLNWAVFAYDSSSSPSSPTNPGGFVSTFSQGPTALNYTQILNADTRANSYLANVNIAGNSTNSGGCATNTSCAQVSSSPAYAGGTNFGSNVASALPTGNNIAGAHGTDALPFWYIRTDSQAGHNTITPGLEMQFANSSNAGMWTLDAAGDATYTLAAAAAVPIPGALWLFGSGLLGLIGISRRKPSVAMTTNS